ncbi:YDG domain-containing protein [Gemmiger sp.]
MKKRVLSLFLAITLCLTLTPTGALAAEGQPPEQMVSVTQEAQIPAPAAEEEEEEKKTTSAENGADENDPPANPEENPTENAPAAAEKNTADGETDKEAAAATGRDEPKADGSPSDDDAAKVQNQLVMAAAAGPDEPTMMGQNNLLALADAGQNAAEERSTTAELTVNEAVVEAASVTKADGTVSTYKTLPAALNAAQDGDTVKLLANHTTEWDAIDKEENPDYSTLAVVKKNLTLDLNGKSVDYLMVGELTYGEPRYDEEENETVDVAIAPGELTIIQGETSTPGSVDVIAFMSGKLTVQGGIINDRIECAQRSDAENITSETKYGGEINITGGTVRSLYVKENTNVTVTGGTGHAGNWLNDSGTLKIQGGKFDSVNFLNNGGTIAISGGEFGTITNSDASSTIPLMPLLANGYAFYKDNAVQDSTAKTMTDVTVGAHTHTPDENGKCACGASIIASVKTADGTERTYGSFTDALAAAVESNDSTLQLLHDIDLGDTKYGLSVDSGKFTLDLNSKTLSGKVDYQLLTVSGTADITIKNGKLVNTFSNDSPAMSRGLANAIQITGGTAVLENVEVTSGCGENGEHTDAVCLSDGNLTVANGTFTGAILVMPKPADQHPVLKITSATLHNGIGYFIWNTSNPDYDGVKALFADGSLLFDKDGNYIDITNEDYWQTDSSEEESFTATIFAYGEECSVKPHTHTIVNGKCSVCGELAGDGCIAHAVWSPYADYPQWRTTHIKTMDELREMITSPSTKWSDFDENATVTFLCDVTVDKTFLIDRYYTNIIIDLNGHTLSGALDAPIITANFGSGPATIVFKNGKIVNTGSGEAIRLAKGRVTLENVDVTGDLSLTPEFVNSRSYIPTFLGGGSFTKICTVNDAGGWQKVLEDMLPKGYYFADITSGKRVSQTVLKADSPLENVTVKPCNHKDADGKSTFTYKPARQTYYYCSICGNICPHEHRTKLADGKLHCEDCGLTLTAARRDSKNTITYYIDMSDAFGNAYQPIIWPLCDQTCTQAAMTYYGSNTIDLNGFTVKASNPSGVLFAPYVSAYTMTLQNSAVNQGRYECEYLKVYNNGTLAIPAENNNLTISEVLIESDGNANLAGGSFGKISVEGEKTLAGLLVPGYYFADTASGEPAAMYDADGNALTELTNVTVKPCRHDTAVCDANGVWKCLCGQNVFVASVTKDDATTYYTDLQTAFGAADGNTVKLLANVQDVTVNTDKPFTFDLNGYNVYSLTVNNKITIKDSATVKGKITEWLEVPSGMTVGELLEDGYAFKKSNGTWCSGVEQAGQAVGDVSIWPMPIRSVTAANPSVTVAYGQTSGVTLTATVVPFAEGGTYTCQWYKIGGTVSPLDGATDSTYQLPVDLAAGTYTYRLTAATEDGYEKSCDFTVTVTPVSIEGAAVNVQSLTYNGNAQNPTATVSLGETVLTENRDYTVTATPQTDVGSYTLTVTGKGNYTGEIENVNWKIEPMQLYRFCDIEPVTKVYDGTAVAPIAKSALTFRTTGAVVTLPEDVYDITNARFTMRQDDGTYVESPEAGNGKSLSFTVTLKNGNYVFKGGTADVMDCDYTTDSVDMFTIMQDTISLSGIQFTQYVFNDLAKTYEIELKPLLDDILSQQQQHAGREYGDIQYGKPSVFMDSDYYPAGGATIGNGNLSLSINKATSSKQGEEIGTVAVQVETTNYQPFTLTIHVSAQDKLVPVLAEGNTVSASDITYGQKLANSTLTATGSMICPRTKKVIPGTFAWTNPEAKPGAAGDYTASWTFTPAEGYEEYAPATGNVTVKVNKADPTFNAPTAQENLTYTGQEQALITAGMTDYGTMQYSLTENGTYSQDIPTGTDAGAYTVWYRVIGDANHNDTAPASVAVSIGKKPLPITEVTAAPKTYDGTTNADISSVTFDNVTLNRGTDYNVTASFDDASVGNGKNITATVTLMGKAANNYALEQSNFLATGSITKAAAPGSGLCPAVTVINDLAKTYEMVLSNDYLPKLSSPCEYGNVSYSLRGTYLTGGYKDTVQVKVMEENGQYKLKLTVPAVDYNRVSSVGTIDVSVTSDNYQDFYLTIGVKTKNKDVPVPDGTISASNITYGQALNDSKITGKMKDDGKTIDGTFAWKNGAINPDAGSYDAEWVFTPAEGYEEYATVTGTAPVTVNRKAVTVSGITAKDKVYDGNTNATLDFSNAKFDGILENDKLTVTAKGVFEKTEAGKWNVAISDLTLGGNSVANYVLAESGNQTETTATITAKEVTVTITPNGGTYGSVTAAAAVLSGVVDGETVPVTLTYTGNGYNSTSVPTDVGSYTVTASIADSNYILTGETTANFVITPKTVIVSGITAKDKAYDGTTNATLDFSNAKFDGILENDKLTVTAKGVFEKTEAGKRAVAISDLTLGGNSVANYVLAESGNQTETTATITAKEVTVAITPNGGTYGSVTAAAAVLSGVVNGETVSVTLTYTGNGYDSTDVPVNAGSYTVTASIANANYTLTGYTEASFVIAKAVAEAPQILGKVYNGRSQSADVAESPLYTVKTNNGGTSVGTYPVELELTDSNNYKWEATDDAVLSLTFTISKTGNKWATVPQISGWTYGGIAATPNAAAQYGDYTVTYAVKDSDTFTADVPTKAGNYTARFTVTDTADYAGLTETVDFVIVPKAVTVSGITANNKAYDGTTNATLDFSNAKFDGILENDKLTVTAKGVFEKTEAGKWKVAISDLTLGGNSVANYVLAESGNQTKTTATITAKQITVSITPNGGTYGETITPATVKANDVVGEDTPTITLTYTGTANDGTEYTGTTPPAKAGTYTVTATTTNPNYTLDPDTNTAEFAITKRPATVTPDNKSKVYEEKDPDLTYAVSGVLDGETLKGITLTRAEGENAGEYAITATADAGANPNYDVTFAEGTLTIELKSIKGAKVVLGKALTANGAEQTQTVEKVLLDDKELPADSYTVAGNTATDPGRYTLTVTAKGNYTDSVEQTYAIAPAKAEDAPGEEIAISSGKVKVDVKSEGTVPPAALLTDKVELLAMLVDSGDITADELAQIADGASVDIVLTVKEANVPDEVKTAMAQAAKGYTIGHYLDISLFKYMTVNGSQQAGVALHTTRDALTISVVVPDALINTNSAVNRTYCIVRNHEGTITVLDAAFDAANKTLTFKTDRFSDYAIAYKDTAVPSSGSNPGSNNSSNDSEAMKNEVAAPTPAPTPASTSKPSTITAMPQTGDTSNPTLYVVLLVASLLGLAVVFVCKKRNDK